MPATKQMMAKSDADFADQFSKDDVPKVEKSEDEVFGTGPEPAPNEPSAEPVPAPPDEQQRLRSWEGRLKAKETELANREAAMSSSSVNRVQSSSDEDDGTEPEVSGDGSSDDNQEDPGKKIAEDFGEDYVELLTKLITKICKKHVGESVGSVSALVDSVIDDLKNERNQNHFRAIHDAHEDFMEIIESPEFNTWQTSQSPEDMARLQKIIVGGSAKEIIGMLTEYKNYRSGSKDFDMDDSLNAAEGVRSSGIQLPKEPSASDDYSSAWNEA